MRQAIIRADASLRLGGGHVMRCLTLARELLRRGWQIEFATNTGAAEALRGISREGIGWNEGFDDNASDVDALQSRFSGGFSLLIIDHYGWSAVQEAALRDFVQLRLAFDDFADRPRDADIILDSNVGAHADRHMPVSPAHALILAGPEFAQLRAEFAEWGAWREANCQIEPDSVDRVVLGFGLTDLAAMTARTAEMLLERNPDLRIDAIIGPQAPSRPRLEILARDHALTVHVGPPNVAEIMAQADLAIGASGQSAYERCCLGLPSIGLSIVDNQVFLVEELERQGATIHVPAMGPGWETKLGNVFERIAGDAKARLAMRRKARRICDGHGASRVADAIESRLSRIEARA